MSANQKLSEQLSFRVAPALYDLVERIAKQERRKPNEVARALLERGAAAYNRDGNIFEPDEADPDSQILDHTDTVQKDRAATSRK